MTLFAIVNLLAL